LGVGDFYIVLQLYIELLKGFFVLEKELEKFQVADYLNQLGQAVCPIEQILFHFLLAESHVEHCPL
jgi:hypothetical protein